MSCFYHECIIILLSHYPILYILYGSISRHNLLFFYISSPPSIIKDPQKLLYWGPICHSVTVMWHFLFCSKIKAFQGQVHPKTGKYCSKVTKNVTWHIDWSPPYPMCYLETLSRAHLPLNNSICYAMPGISLLVFSWISKSLISNPLWYCILYNHAPFRHMTALAVPKYISPNFGNFWNQ